MNLYHKYRPSSLNKMFGNEEVVSALLTMVEKNEVPHTILLHGGTGCGKTTIARIIQKALGVDKDDYMEMNSSDMRGIDTIRDLIKNIQFKPFKSSCRIFTIDECHKLTNDAQNAFLKIAEDTPEHIRFILCTTEPEKLIKPLRGRCVEFQVKPLETDELKRLLKYVLRKEEQQMTDDILNIIVDVSEGHPRNALQILEKLINLEPEQRAAAAVKTSAETVQSIELCRILMNNKATWAQVRDILSGLKNAAVDPESVRRQVMGYCEAVLLKGDNMLAGLILEEFIEPFYNSGFPGVVRACYSVIKNK